MKKKQIEKVPYLGLRKTTRKRKVKYIAVTAVKNVAHERHFFLEVYENKKEKKEIPVARLVFTKKDFATYYPEKDEWTRQKIKQYAYPYNLIWEEDTTYKNEEETAQENILFNDKDRERVEKFFDKHKPYNESKWWEFLENAQHHIISAERNRAQKRQYERREKALKEREENIPELPEKELLDMADRVLFHNKHYLYYKKRGSYAQIACSKCGGVTKARWKEEMSYESQFERYTEEPREGKIGHCPMCGETGEYKCQGKVHSSHDKTVYVFFGSRYKENGFVMRYIELTKEWQLQLICGEKGPEMYNACEAISGVEIARGYFEPGHKVQIDYHKQDPYTGRNFWDDCNLYGLSGIRIKDSYIMPETYENMKGTFLQYSALKEYEMAVGEINPIKYLERYIEAPQIEMLVKMNLTKLAKRSVNYGYDYVKKIDAARVDTFLGIRKEHVKQLIDHKGDTDILRTMQMEKRMDQKWTNEQIEQLTEIEIEQENLTVILQHMTIQKLLNRIKKYAGCEYGTGCSSAWRRIRHTAQTYFDYLEMRQALGYDLNNTIYQQPRDLETAHAKMVAESNKIETDKRLKEVAEKYPTIRKHYRRIRNKYFYEDKELQIRPARSAEEIVIEGKTLHHCVGRDTYLKKHNCEESIILLLRHKEKLEIPYITVEIDNKTMNIKQWYGAHDKKQDKENIQKWIDSYETRLKCGGMAAVMGTEVGEENKNIILYA